MDTINIRKQKGVVLLVALVFLISLTAVASALMLNTTSDMKMSGASQEKLIALQEVVSSVDEVILLQVPAGGDNLFKGPVFPQAVAVTAENTDANITNPNINSLVVQCPASFKPSSGKIGCITVSVQAIKTYGNNQTSSITVNAGIIQHVLNTSGG